MSITKEYTYRMRVTYDAELILIHDMTEAQVRSARAEISEWHYDDDHYPQMIIVETLTGFVAIKMTDVIHIDWNVVDA